MIVVNGESFLALELAASIAKGAGRAGIPTTWNKVFNDESDFEIVHQLLIFACLSGNFISPDEYFIDFCIRLICFGQERTPTQPGL